MGASFPNFCSTGERVSVGTNHHARVRRSISRRQSTSLRFPRVFGWRDADIGSTVTVSRAPGIDDRLSVIRRTAFYLYIPEEMLRDFAGCFTTIIKVRAGEDVPVYEGNIYCLVDGELEVSTTLPSQNTKNGDSTQGYLCKKSPGDILTASQAEKGVEKKLNSSKLKHYVERVRHTARKNIVLLTADKLSLDTFLKNKKDLRLSVNAIAENRITDYLARLNMLKSIRPSQIDTLAAMCRYEAVPEGTAIFYEGDSGRKLYILVTGSVSVTSRLCLAPPACGRDSEGPGNCAQSEIRTNSNFEKAVRLTRNGELFGDIGVGGPVGAKGGGTASSHNKDFILLAMLKDGDYFGETALMVDIPRTTTVTATQKSLLLTVERGDWTNFLKVCPYVRYDMMKIMKDRMIEKLSSLEIPFFQGISNAAFAKITESIEIEEFRADDVVFCEGDIGHHFYIVIHGTVQIIGKRTTLQSAKAGDWPKVGTFLQDVGLLGPGMYFGEMALVSDAPRSATVISKGKTVLLSMGKSACRLLFDSNRTAAAEFQLKLFQGGAQLCHILEHPRGLMTFRMFLEKELASENVNFWEKSKEFRASNFTDKEERLLAAKQIFNDFCDENADSQVNLPSSIREHIRNTISEGDISTTVFDQATNEIYKLMVRDNYARFKSNGQLENFLCSLGIFI